MTTTRWLDQDGVLSALAADDGVVILPTDTLPGMHARLDRPEAVARLRVLKGREQTKPLLVLCAGSVAVEALTTPLSPATRRYLSRLWPGPFTVILPAAGHLSVATIAVRVPSPADLRELLARSGPLASTSVNRAGCAPAMDVAEATTRFPGLPVWQVSLPAGEALASALVDLTGAKPHQIRTGPAVLPPWDDVLG